MCLHVFYKKAVKTFEPEFLFDKFPEACNFEKETPAQVFPCELYKISQNSFQAEQAPGDCLPSKCLNKAQKILSH